MWTGGVYLQRPDWGDWELRMEIQSHDPTSMLFVNDRALGLLPTKNWEYSWVTARVSVPRDLLRSGYNRLEIRMAPVVPKFHSPTTIWDEVLVRDIVLERVTRP